MKSPYLPSIALRHLADYSRSHYFVEAPFGVTIEDLMQPKFWAHHTLRLKRLDIVEVFAEDGSFDVDLRVVDVQVGYVKMRALRVWSDGAIAAATAERVAEQEKQEAKAAAERFPSVRFTKLQRWHVLGHDGNVVKDGFTNRPDAERCLTEYVARSKQENAA
jgi:hypothetical protein